MEQMVVSADRRRQLKKNFRNLFFVQAFLNVKTINLVGTLFLVERGLALSQVFYLSIVWAISNIVGEVPSSYLADRWGRKNTILLAVALNIVSGLLFAASYSFPVFCLRFFLFGLSYAAMSGTDDALLYDSARELGEEKTSLQKLGHYYSAERIFKIITPLLGAFIAADLLDQQFLILIFIDTLCAVIAGVYALGLTDARHYMDLEKVEAGVMKDAWRLLRTNPFLTKAITNRALIFIGSFIIWRYHQTFFVDRGLSIVVLGVAWSIFNTVSFFSHRNIARVWPKFSPESKIDILNFIFFTALGALAVFALAGASVYVLLLLYFVAFLSESSRESIFSEIFNKRSLSFNRATTLSLANFVKSLFDLPLLLGGAWLVSRGNIYPLYLSIGIAFLVVLFFHLSSTKMASGTKAWYSRSA